MATAGDPDAHADDNIVRALTELSSVLARTGLGALNQVVAPLVRRGFASPLPIGVGAVVLVTTGRRTGQRREVPLMGARLGDTLVVSTVRENADWVLNIEASPEVTVWVDREQREGLAEVRRLPRLDVAVIRLRRRTDAGADSERSPAAISRRPRDASPLPPDAPASPGP